MTGTLAIVLARGGSKGLPRKNVLPVAGRPCMSWTIDAALSAGTVDAVLVSSDDDEVLAIAEAAGCAVHRRGEETADDAATVDAAAREACAAWADGHGEPARVVILYGNVPVRPDGLIDDAVRTLIDTGADSVQSYGAVGKHHPWWTARLDDGGAVRPWEGDVLNHGVYRRQDLPPAFVPDGGVLVVTRAALFLEVDGAGDGPHAFFGRDRRGVVSEVGSDGVSVIDIDSAIDRVVADAALRGRGRGRGHG